MLLALMKVRVTQKRPSFFKFNLVQFNSIFLWSTMIHVSLVSGKLFLQRELSDLVDESLAGTQLEEVGERSTGCCSRGEFGR